MIIEKSLNLNIKKPTSLHDYIEKCDSINDNNKKINHNHYYNVKRGFVV